MDEDTLLPFDLPAIAHGEVSASSPSPTEESPAGAAVTAMPERSRTAACEGLEHGCAGVRLILQMIVGLTTLGS